ncbi:glycosyl hydrolase family 18 protein [Vibrio pectenicida]|uniref:chitinase n=1 Tax=Vibrio pectenicida TaxID=62763 RepID=A0A427TZJ3_9VIBR|nr:glycosyl hydrolase family 18 protein [Vibrio pectenicida]RSD29766.1 hypothetical protein EJA03_17460 [Vibrio pectenicida]
MKTPIKLSSLAVLIALSSMSTSAFTSPRWSDAEKVFNTYERNDALVPVAGYLSNWGVYERGFNINDIKGKYDKLVYSFMGICGSKVGDPAITSAVTSVASICARNNYPDYTIVFTDPNSDYQADYGGGNGHWNSELQGPASFETGQKYAGGLIGVLRDMKKEDPNLELAFSVGGWSLSEPFSRMASSPQSRKVFIDSAIQWFTLYPMFDQIDIDWEYPGGGGASGNSWSEQDGENYTLLIKELRAALVAAGIPEKKIAIAAGAPASKLDASNIKALIDNGLDYVHLMTYDFMGEWQDKLAHHTNLSGEAFKNDESFNSAEKSIDYMIDVLGIPSTSIQIGYANYSRNAGAVDLQSVSPLIGSFTPGTSTNKSYDTGVSELYDYADKLVTFNQMGGQGLEGYEIYTDIDTNADFLFNKVTNQFLSIDTPRSVYAKAAYAKNRNLGGIFNWMVDHDPGYHINAAREGLGYRVVNTTLDMTNIVKACGFIDKNETTLSEEACKALTGITDDSVNPGPNLAPVANAGKDKEVEGEVTVHLSGSASYDPEGKALSYAWVQINGSEVSLTGANLATPSFVAPEVEEDTSYTFSLTVTDPEGLENTDTIVVKNQASEDGNTGGGGSCSQTDPEADNVPAWVSGQVYTTETVNHNGLVYTAKWWNKDEPTPATQSWTLTSEVELPWTAAGIYNGGDEVDHNGSRWQAKWWTQGNEPNASSDVWLNIGEAHCQ